MSDIQDNIIYTSLNSTVEVHRDAKPGAYFVGRPEGRGMYGVLGEIQFQEGPIKAVGETGVMLEHLLAVCIDRLEELNEKFSSVNNERALEYMRAALDQLEQRTKERLNRGVEGTLQA